MKNIVKFVVCMALIFSIMICSTVNVSAYLYKPSDMDSAEQLKHVEYWTQFDDPWANDPIGNTGSSYRGAGCSTYAAAYMLVKMGLLDPKKGDTAKTLIDKAENCSTYMWNGKGESYYFNYDEIDKLYPDIKYEGRADYNTVPIDEAVTVAKKKISEGYYCIMQVEGTAKSGAHAGHMIFIDGVTSDGKMSVGDSGFGPGTTLEDIYEMSTLTSWYLELFSYKVPCNEQPSIYDDTAIRTGESSYTKADEAAYIDLVSEWQLVGMPEKSKLNENIVRVTNSSDDGNAFKLEEKENIASILESKKAQTPTLAQILGTIMSVVGLIILAYSLLLLIGFFLDRFNSFIDVSIVGILTFGKIKIVTKEERRQMSEEEAKRSGYSTGAKLFTLLLILCIIGGLMLSGTILKVVYLVTGKILG